MTVFSRRTILAGAAASVAMASEARAVASELRPGDLGRKFSRDGRVLPFAGDTIICHWPQQGPDSGPFDALLDIYRALPTRGWTRKLAALPPSSYHTTIFGGADDKDRHYPLWPTDLPLDMPMPDCDRVLADRLRSFRLGRDAGPYRMKVDPQGGEVPLSIWLVPADQDTADRLRRLRDRLSDLFAIRDPKHDLYRFHVTLGYLFAPLTADESSVFRADLAGWKEDVRVRAGTIVLGQPEYCLLNDMFAFKRQFYLS